ncbi:MAG: CHAT domain-containing tetratricopeptide repeat protein, partial [Acidobacteriota bacterium]
AAFDRAAGHGSSARARLAIELARGWVLRRLGRPDAARRVYEPLDAVCREAGSPSTVCRATIERLLGLTALQAGEIDVAIERLERAATSLAEHAPRSLVLGRTLASLGSVLFRVDRRAGALDALQRADAVFMTVLPASAEHARVMVDLGAASFSLGDLDTAETLFHRVLETDRRVTATRARLLSLLGSLASERGRLAEAEAWWTTSLDVARDVGDRRREAAVMTNLGLLALDRGDPALATERLDASLMVALDETANQDVGTVVATLHHLSLAALAADDLELARRHAEDAYERSRQVSSSSYETSHGLFVLGQVAWRSGALETAVDHWRAALTIQETIVPDSVALATTLRHLGGAQLELGSWDRAVHHLARSLAILERHAPGSRGAAESLHGLAHAWWDRDPERAVARLARATDHLETQIGRLGGTEGHRSALRGDHHDIHHDYVDSLLVVGREADAFAALERSRAQSFLTLLRSRELRFADVPTELDRRRRRVMVRYDQVHEQLIAASRAGDETRLAELQRTLRALRRERDQVHEAMRRHRSPAAELEAPRTVDVEAARRALDPGTVMVSYAVGRTSVLLFVLDHAGPLETLRLAVDPATLERDVERFRRLIVDEQPGTMAASARENRRRELGQRLYDTLLAPIATRVAAAERLLVIPDGALHRLPWAALERRDGTFLIEHRPFFLALSATVYAASDRPTHDRPATVRVDAFADPRFTLVVETVAQDSAGASSEVADTTRSSQLELWAKRGVAPTPLPATRDEVASIVDAFPASAGHRVDVHLGDRATETRLKTLDRATTESPPAYTSILHVATHTVLDADAPLDSAVLLSAPERVDAGYDNGLLQAWEIFEELRLDVDLVTLSSCSSALGRERRGEGLIGMTRAFQVAGARVVLASLWDVADVSTAESMSRFYRRLATGASFADALRAAQLVALHDGRPAREWAAFQLFGDWR